MAKLESKYSNDQEDLSEMRKLIAEQKVKILSCLRKDRNEILDKHENLVDDYEAEFKANENDIKHLQDLLNTQNKL